MDVFDYIAYSKYVHDEIICMKETELGYRTKIYDFPTKRYFQRLDLKKNPTLIEMYKKRHQKEFYWDVVGKGIREAGILDMEIFIYNEHLVMVVETALDFDWDEAFDKLAKDPIQIEWEEYMSIFQNANSNSSSTEKWQKMERIFSLP